jgi:SM-20-related protein
MGRLGQSGRLLSIETCYVNMPPAENYLPDPGPEFDFKLEIIVNALEKSGWCVVPNFLESSLWRAVAAEARQMYAQGEFRQAGVGRKQTLMIRPEIRNDRVLWLDPAAPTQLQSQYLWRMELVRQRINRELQLGLFGFESHYALYPAGSFYQRHLDQFKGASHRMVSCILYLNDAWQPADGGALRVYLPLADCLAVPLETHLDVFPEGGSLVVFLSAGFEHEVLPAKRERMSVTGWFFKIKGPNPII